MDKAPAAPNPPSPPLVNKVRMTREEARTVGAPPPGGWKDQNIINEIAADLDRTKAAADAAAKLSEDEERRKFLETKLLQKKKALNKAKLPHVALVDEINSNNVATRESVEVLQQIYQSHNRLLAQNGAFRKDVQELRAELRIAINLLVSIAKNEPPQSVFDEEQEEKDNKEATVPAAATKETNEAPAANVEKALP